MTTKAKGSVEGVLVIDDFFLADAWTRAAAWARQNDGTFPSRESSFNETAMALDVLDLIEEVRRLRRQIEKRTL